MRQRLTGLSTLIGIILIIIIYSVIMKDKTGYKEYYRVEIDTLTKVVYSKIDTVDIPVKITFYQPTEAQCDASPLITADNSKINEDSYYKWCAVSRDLMYFFTNFGDTIVIANSEGDTTRLIVKDNMNERFSKTIDIIVPNGAIDAMFSDSRIYPYIQNNSNCKIIKILRP